MCSCSFSVLYILLLLQTSDSHRSDLVCPFESMFPCSGYVPGQTSQTPVCLPVAVPVLFLFCFYIGLTLFFNFAACRSHCWIKPCFCVPVLILYKLFCYSFSLQTPPPGQASQTSCMFLCSCSDSV